MNWIMYYLSLPLVISIVAEMLCLLMYWFTYKATMTANKVKLKKGDEFGKWLLFILAVYSITLLPLQTAINLNHWAGFLFLMGEAVLTYILVRLSVSVICSSYSDISNIEVVRRKLGVRFTIVFLFIVVIKIVFLVLYYFGLFESMLVRWGVDSFARYFSGFGSFVLPNM